MLTLTLTNGSTVTGTPTEIQAFLAGAKATTRTKKAAPKADTPKAPRVQKRSGANKVLTRANREEFIAAHAWAKGLSTNAITRAALDNPASYPLTKGWALGARRVESLTK